MSGPFKFDVSVQIGAMTVYRRGFVVGLLMVILKDIAPDLKMNNNMVLNLQTASLLNSQRQVRSDTK